MIIKQVPEGQRKLIATVVTMVVGLVAEKYLGGLSDNLAILIGGALALFVGGNAMEYVANIKGTKSPNLPPPQQQVEEMVETPAVDVSAIQKQLNTLDNICGQVFGKYDQQFKDLQAAVDKQSENTKSLIAIVNGKRNVNVEQPKPFPIPRQDFTEQDR